MIHLVSRKELNETMKAHIVALNESTTASKTVAAALNYFGKELHGLASETGAWRKEDTKHHEAEDGKDAEKITKMDKVITILENINRNQV